MRGKRFSLLLVDQTAQRKDVGLIANVPVRCPCQLAKAADAARFGHAGQTKIEPVGEQSGHQDVVVSSRFASAQVGEAVGELGPGRHLGQQVGDADRSRAGLSLSVLF